MKEFLKNNWFKLSLLLIILILGVGFLSYLKERQDWMSKNIAIQIEEKNKQALSDQFANACITDAYTELKTLQGNFDILKINFCVKGDCGTDFWNKAKAEAFKTYEDEWIPQCKLGKRVFLHYEPLTLNDVQ